MDIPSLFDMLTWELDLILVGLSHHRLFWDLCLKQIYLPWIHAISQMKSNRSHRSQSLPWLLPCCSSRASSLWAQPLHLNGAFFSPQIKALWSLSGCGGSAQPGWDVTGSADVEPCFPSCSWQFAHNQGRAGSIWGKISKTPQFCPHFELLSQNSPCAFENLVKNHGKRGF